MKNKILFSIKKGGKFIFPIQKTVYTMTVVELRYIGGEEIIILLIQTFKLMT